MESRESATRPQDPPKGLWSKPSLRLGADSMLAMRTNALVFAIIGSIFIASAIAAFAYAGTPVAAPAAVLPDGHYLVVLTRSIAIGGSVRGDFRAEGNFSVRLWILNSNQYTDFLMTSGPWSFDRGTYRVTGRTANVSADLPALETWYLVLETNATGQDGGPIIVELNLTFSGFDAYYFGAGVVFLLLGGLAMFWSTLKGLREPVSRPAPSWKK